MTQTNGTSHIISIDDYYAGILVEDLTQPNMSVANMSVANMSEAKMPRFRFVACDARFLLLDGSKFRSVESARKAARTLARVLDDDQFDDKLWTPRVYRPANDGGTIDLAGYCY